MTRIIIRYISYVSIVLVLGLAGLGNGTSFSAEDSQMEIGYWLWSMSDSPYANPPGVRVPDVLYVEVGEYRHRGVGMTWPPKVPKALRYLAVVRVEGTKTPETRIIPELISEYYLVQRKAAASGQLLTGLQIDFDCPTGKLNTYADFLKELREALPKEEKLSITALVDWFGPKSDVAELIKWADEYVPQFYDVFATSDKRVDSSIAMKIDPKKWGQIFNSYGHPYRMGISAFGRISEIEEESGKSTAKDSSKETIKERYYRYSGLLDVMRDVHYNKISEIESSSGEKIVLFKRTDISKCRHKLKVTIPTKKSLLSAYDAAKAMAGHCKGVVFYRWPADTESMVLTPGEIHDIIAHNNGPDAPVIEARDGYCSVVNCMDLFVGLSDRFPEKAVSLLITASSDLEYFIPAESTEGRQTGARSIEILAPAYSGRPRLYIGRAVLAGPSRFSVEVIK